MVAMRPEREVREGRVSMKFVATHTSYKHINHPTHPPGTTSGRSTRTWFEYTCRLHKWHTRQLPGRARCQDPEEAARVVLFPTLSRSPRAAVLEVPSAGFKPASRWYHGAGSSPHAAARRLRLWTTTTCSISLHWPHYIVSCVVLCCVPPPYPPRQ